MKSSAFICSKCHTALRRMKRTEGIFLLRAQKKAVKVVNIQLFFVDFVVTVICVIVFTFFSFQAEPGSGFADEKDTDILTCS